MDLNGKSLLVTGGTGSFGRAFVKEVFLRFPDVRRVVVFSRDELKQYEMRQEFSASQLKKLRFFIGDVRDRDRLERACERVDVVIHAAALKQVPAAEYNPMECIKTNVLGAENVIQAALTCGIRRVVALSTDKAAAPINLYGATKLCSDKLFTAANNIVGDRDLKFSVVRYGNVMGSRGSVIPFFLEKRQEGSLPITHEGMTRFNITLQQGVDLVLTALSNAWGGEIFVPKIPSYRIMDVARAVAPDAKTEVIGVRPGEKIHEEMITETDSLSTLDCGDYYVIVPTTPSWEVDSYVKKFQAQKVPFGFKYNSGTNDEWLSPEQIRVLIKEHVDCSFRVV